MEPINIDITIINEFTFYNYDIITTVPLIDFSDCVSEDEKVIKENIQYTKKLNKINKKKRINNYSLLKKLPLKKRACYSENYYKYFLKEYL